MIAAKEPFVCVSPLALLAALVAAARRSPADTRRRRVGDGPAQARRAVTTAEQIDAFIKSSPARDARREDDGRWTAWSPRDDGKPHGEVAVGVGTGGYRSVYGRAEIPVGQNGRLSLAFEDTKRRLLWL